MKDCIEIIKENARNFPNRIAVIDGERKISYSAFWDMVCKISCRITRNTKSPKIVFDLNQGLEAYALIIATLNVGGSYCPLNPDAPIERKIQIINEFAPDLIIVETEDSQYENATNIRNLLIEEKNIDIPYNHTGDDIIYVIYTSGTTGVSKGVMICRKALNKFLEWAIPTYGANENDIWGQFSLLSFDLSIVDIFTCLCSGATLFSMNDIPTKNNWPSQIVEKEKITIWHSIPSAIEFMMLNDRRRIYDFSSLRLMSFCGEPLRKHQVEFLYKKNNEIVVFNTYGPTEGTLFCTWQELTSTNYLNYCDFTMSIGKPIPGWNIKLASIDKEVEKEVIIYGDYIGKGYLKQVVLNKFNDVEIDGKIESGFETGDLVTEKDGNLYFSCRKDRQVKVKGFRIELDEIDFVINGFLNKPCATLVNDGVLYTFIQSDDGKGINEQELRDYLKVKLEGYKIPNSFYPIKEIPRNANQKVDLNQLIRLLPTHE